MNQFIEGFFGNSLIMTAVISWGLAQVIKFIYYYIVNSRIDMRRLFGSGGMPSSHSACVSSLAAVSAREFGISSPFFAISFILACIVMYDAANVRYQAGQHAKALNRIIEHYDVDLNYHKSFDERLGHTPFEVAMGAVLGVIVALFMPM